MHDLIPTTALGGTAPRIVTIGSLEIAEVSDLALASVAARLGRADECGTRLGDLLKAELPGAGQAALGMPFSAVWMGPDQWMIGAPLASHELLADTLSEALGDTASVTEQTGAWAVFDLRGTAMPAACELLCAVPIRRMIAGEARRTMIHQLGCFVLRGPEADHVRILGPRASAQSLHHALVTAAKAVS